MPMRQVCGLDVHNDSVFVCIVNETGVVLLRIIWCPDNGFGNDALINPVYESRFLKAK